MYIHDRTKKEETALNKYLNKLALAQKCQFRYTIDEYIVAIYNIFICCYGASKKDKDLLNFLAHLSASIGNKRNESIIRLELQRLETGTNELQLKNFQKLEALCSENIRTEIRSLIGLNDSPEGTKYCLEFDDRFRSCVLTFCKIEPPSPSLVLDIGTGMGFLPFIFNQNGHSAYSIDQANGDKIFTKSIEILGIKRREFTVKKFINLITLGHKFNVINASLICFNQHGKEDLWQRNEWLYFLKDMYENQLADEGVLYLGFNAETSGRTFLGSDELYQFFEPFILPHDPSNTEVPLIKISKSDIKSLI